MRQSEAFSTAFKIVLNDSTSDGSPKHGKVINFSKFFVSNPMAISMQKQKRIQ